MQELRLDLSREDLSEKRRDGVTDLALQRRSISVDVHVIRKRL